MQPRVSIIIPVYNGEKYIRNSIIKLQMQTYANLEVIYVDDGSTDQTGIILDETATEDDRFRVIHKENGGVSAARNTGIKAATWQSQAGQMWCCLASGISMWTARKRR